MPSSASPTYGLSVRELVKELETHHPDAEVYVKMGDTAPLRRVMSILIGPSSDQIAVQVSP